MPKETFTIVRVAYASLDVTIEADDKDDVAREQALEAARSLDFTGRTVEYEHFIDGDAPYADIHHITVGVYEHDEHGSNELCRTPEILNDEELQVLIDAVVIATETQDLEGLTDVARTLNLCEPE